MEPAIAIEDKIRHARSLPGRPHEERLVSVGGILALARANAEQRAAENWLTFFDDDSGESLRLTHAEFLERVLAAAGALRSLGVGPGDRVATMLGAYPETVVLYFACWALGACVAPVNPGEDDNRVGFVVENSEAKVLFCRPEYLDRVQKLRHSMPRVKTVAISGASAPDGVPLLSDLARAHRSVSALPKENLDAEALLVYTSGTTGAPKGVVLTQYNLLADAWAISRWQQIGPATRMMCVLPLHHVNGITVTLVTPLLAGASVVLCKKFSARAFWGRVAAEGVHIVSVVPTLLQFLLDAGEDLSRHDLSLFRHFICGAGTLSVALTAQFEDRFSKRVLHGYGMSEGTCYSCFLPVDLSDDEHRMWLRGHGYPSIGCAIEANEMAIHDPEGHPAAPGEKGEIVYRGHNVMTGYYGRSDANREAFAHGWFRSGDEGFHLLDGSGRAFYFISGRLKELINRGGVKYSPFEIEEVLAELPAVRTALVVGFENKYYGEEVGCYLVAHEGQSLSAEEVLAHCRRRMPFAKCPKVVVFGKDVPVTSTGKYQRLSLKPMFRSWEDVQFRETD